MNKECSMGGTTLCQLPWQAVGQRNECKGSLPSGSSKYDERVMGKSSQ